MYRGVIVADNNGIDILAHHEPASEGTEASRYVQIEAHQRKNAAYFDNLDAFKLACHQNKYGLYYRSPEHILPCPAKGIGPYTGPTFTPEEIYSLPYLDLYQDEHDHENDPDGSVPVHSSDIGWVWQELRESPAQVQRCIEAIRAAGDRYTHRARERITDQKYVGKDFFRFNSQQFALEFLHVVDYDHDSYGYWCTVQSHNQSETGRGCWVPCSEVQSACDGSDQGIFDQINATIKHLQTSNYAPVRDFSDEL